MEKVRSILLKGYYGFGNLGDDLLMIISYRLLRSHYPSASIAIFSNHTVNLKSFRKAATYNRYIHDLVDAQPTLIDWTYRGHFDLVFNGGGGVFFDGTRGGTVGEIRNAIVRWLGPSAVRKIDRLARRILSKPAHISFDKQVGAGIGLGPYAKGSARLPMHLSELGSFETLLVRDPKSLEFLSAINFKGKKILSSDLAFARSFLPLHGSKKQAAKPGALRLGVVLQDIPERRQELFLAIRNFISSQKEIDVTFFSFDENYDRTFIESFKDQRLIVWQPDKMNLNSFIEVFCRMDTVISARAHGVILAGLLNIVPISLNVSLKLTEVSRYFPDGGLLVQNPFDDAAILQAWHRVNMDYDVLVKKVEEEVRVQEDMVTVGLQQLFPS